MSVVDMCIPSRGSLSIHRIDSRRQGNGMPNRPQFQLSFATRVAALYVTIFIVSGVQMPFLPVWLRAKGLDAGTIGLVLAAPMVARVFAIPIVTRLADRREALRETLIAAGFISVAAYLLLALSDGALAIFLAFALVSLTYTPVMPLTETYAMRGLTALGRAYGPVRLWGSASFIAGNLAAGLANDLIAARHLIWLIVAASLLVALSTLTLPAAARAPPPAAAPARPGKPLLRDPLFLSVIAAASLIQASHALFYGFSALAWRAAGYDGVAIAALWSLGVIAEIVLFALHGRLPAWLSPGMLMLAGAAGAILRWTAMAFDPPGAMLSVLQLLHALSFGATHLGTMALVTRLAPHGQGATAQGYLAVVMGVAMALATAVSGVLFGAFGAGAYAAMALTAVVGGGCALVAHRAGRVAAL
jgi:PPP family 3-phenylpropionic acid transporter